MTQIDLSQLAPPDIVEDLSFEAVFQELRADFQRLYPEWSAALESDPVVKLLELAAYREMLVRARVNDAARACMLAYAVGTDLDHLAALLKVERLVVDPGDPEADPPIEPTLEKDDRLRLRAQMSLEGQTVAGSIGAYTFHALSASGRVKDVAVDRPVPGDVRITVLATDNDGMPDAALLTLVADYLSAETRRPLNDTVITAAPTRVDFAVDAVLHFYPGPSSAPALAAASETLDRYLASADRLGYDITRSGLFAALHQPGVRQVVLNSPAADVLIGGREYARCTAVTITEGGRDV